MEKRALAKWKLMGILGKYAKDYGIRTSNGLPRAFNPKLRPYDPDEFSEIGSYLSKNPAIAGKLNRLIGNIGASGRDMSTSYGRLAGLADMRETMNGVGFLGRFFGVGKQYMARPYSMAPYKFRRRNYSKEYELNRLFNHTPSGYNTAGGTTV